MKRKLVRENINNIKDPALVRLGDKTSDYNNEKGKVIGIAQYPSKEFDELVSDADEIREYIEEGDWVMEVEGEEYGPFGGFGSVIFNYGYDGAYVPF